MRSHLFSSRTLGSTLIPRATTLTPRFAVRPVPIIPRLSSTSTQKPKEHKQDHHKQDHHKQDQKEEHDYLLPHPIWHGEYVDGVEVTHRNPKSLADTAAKATIKLIRFNFDWMTGYSFKPHPDAQTWVRRVMFLESIAGVPGSVAGTLRHLRSLRRMERDHGWIHTLLEEAENERMHLLTFLQLAKPGQFMRFCVFMAQGIFFNFFFLCYILSPRFAHRLVGYLEEEAVLTYTKLLKEIDAGHLPGFNIPAPDIAKRYWKMPATATFRDVVAIIRADESHHRDVNHGFASLKPDEDNPYNRAIGLTRYVDDTRQPKEQNTQEAHKPS